MKNLFIAHTPYNVLLSCGIALEQEGSIENHLIVTRNFSGVGALLYSLKRWELSPFARIEGLPITYGRNGRFKKRFTIRKNIKMIARYVCRHSFGRVYVFNDMKPEAQAALHFAKKSNRNAVGVYVEDGTAAYHSYTVEKRPLYIVLLKKLFWGFWWDEIRIHGTSRWIDEAKAIFPHLLRPEIRSKHVTDISKHSLMELKNLIWPYEYLSRVGVTIDELNNNADVILIVAHSKFANKHSKYKEIVKDILDIITGINLRVAVKYHPRESMGNFLSLTNTKEIMIIPQYLPVELIYILLSEKIKCVIGDVSTSLLTAKWLLDSATIYSLASILGYTDLQLIKSFHKLGIKMLRAPIEIEKTPK